MRLLLPLLAATTAAGLALAYWLGSQLVALHLAHSAHVVYLLFDGRGRALYVGMTDDPDRRLGQHRRAATKGDDDWRQDIAGLSIARHCWSEAQARRCEARMIRALTLGGRWRVGPTIHNEVLYARSGPAGTVVPLAGWWVVSVLFHGPRWHRPNPRRLAATPGPVSFSGPDQRQPVSRIPSACQPERHPPPVGGIPLLRLLSDDAHRQPQLQPPKVSGRGGRRPAGTAEERLTAKRAKDARAAKAYRARQKTKAKP